MTQTVLGGYLPRDLSIGSAVLKVELMHPFEQIILLQVGSVLQ